MSELHHFSDYLFIFAHPDDEVYCCGLMHQLIQSNKKVSVVFLTSGDAGENSDLREQEASSSMRAVGVRDDDIYLMQFPEKQILGNFPDILSKIREIVKKVGPDCVIGMDYEGGHEVHDGTSFLTACSIGGLSLAYYVFPVYHGENGKRKAAVFLPNRPSTDEIQLTSEDVNVKIKAFEAHGGQVGHFLRLQRDNPDYFKLLFHREIFRKITKPINYLMKPADDIAYESHRNGFKFQDFLKAVKSVKTD